MGDVVSPTNRSPSTTGTSDWSVSKRLLRTSDASTSGWDESSLLGSRSPGFVTRDWIWAMAGQ